MRDKDNNLVFYKETEENHNHYSRYATKAETGASPVQVRSIPICLFPP
jgi:hypothetical protein